MDRQISLILLDNDAHIWNDKWLTPFDFWVKGVWFSDLRYKYLTQLIDKTCIHVHACPVQLVVHRTDGPELKKVLRTCHAFTSVFVRWWAICHRPGLTRDKAGTIRIRVARGFTFTMAAITNGSTSCRADVCAAVAIWRATILTCARTGWPVDWRTHYVAAMRTVISNTVGGAWACVLTATLVRSRGADGFIACYTVMLWTLCVRVALICCQKTKQNKYIQSVK